MAAPSFSRLQLAAALLEYDNDPDDPNAEFKSAKESAIFAHLRRPAPVRRVEDDYLQQEDEEDEDLPLASRKSVVNAKQRAQFQSNGSADGRTSVVPSVVDPEAEAEAEMLSAWGIDGIVPKSEKRNSTLSMGQASGSRLRPLSEHIRPALEIPVIRPGLARPLSLGDTTALVIEGPERTAEPASAPVDNRKSLAVQLDFNVISPSEPSTAPLTAEPRNSVNFPSSTSPQSTPGEEISNPFAVPLPNPDRLSKFDPKYVGHDRHASILSLNKDAPEGRPKSWIADEFMNEPGNRPRSRYSSTGDQLDIDSTVPNFSRTGTGSMGTQMMVDSLEPSPMPSPKEHEAKRLSRLDLLRPKVLVMPTPLQEKVPTTKKTRDGFFTTDDGGFPLPPGSRTQVRPGPRPMSSLNVLDPSLNPRMSMSLSQLTFRQSLMVGGERDPSYFDIDRELKVAERDGIQIKQDWSDDEEADDRKPAGKLYGTSLIDNLEQRKAATKGKQRVFTGDDRPSMMQRPSFPSRTSTFIDPLSLPSRPSTTYLTPTQVQEDIRKKRLSGIPLVSFDSEPILSVGPSASRPDMPQTKSVFGVDKVWERELEKLKAIEEAEEAERIKQAEKDAMELAEAAKKDKKGMKSRSESAPAVATLSSTAVPHSPDPMSSPDPDLMPSHARRESHGSLGARGWFNAAESDEDGEGLERNTSSGSHFRPGFSRKVSAPMTLPQIPGGGLMGGDSDEEDVPLAQQIGRRPPPSKSAPRLESDSDEDKPIAVLKRNPSKSSPTHETNVAASAPPNINFDSFASELTLNTPGIIPPKKDDGSSSDDEVPLAVRHPSANRLSTMPSGEDEDDKPLGSRYSTAFGPSQAQLQHQFQQHQIMQQQMLQQQIMLQTQAQMRASMAFGAGMGMMGSPYGAVPSPMSMPLINPMMPVEPTTTDTARVDQWRRNIM